MEKWKKYKWTTYRRGNDNVQQNRKNLFSTSLLRRIKLNNREVQFLSYMNGNKLKTEIAQCC